MNEKVNAGEIADASQLLDGMSADEKNALFESILERVADSLGDINPPVLKRFYALHPEAENLFPEERLELMMIDQALYCVSVWLQRPMEIEILLAETVDHHEQTLQVPMNQFVGLFDSLIGTLRDSVSADDLQSLALLDSINSDLQTLVMESI